MFIHSIVYDLVINCNFFNIYQFSLKMVPNISNGILELETLKNDDNI